MQTQSYGRFRERITNLLLSMAPEQHMEGEGAAVGGGGVLKGGYRIFALFDELHNSVSRESCIGRVISLLALPLHDDECFAKVLDFSGKSAHCRLIVALVSGVPVFQRPVSLYPGCISPNGTGQPVGAAMSEGVKQGIIGGADGAAQFGLAGATPVSAHRAGCQLPGDSYQIARVHWIRSLYTLFHSDFDMNEWPGVLSGSISGTCSSKRRSMPIVHLESSFFWSPSNMM